jgi:hypothetical protein
MNWIDGVDLKKILKPNRLQEGNIKPMLESFFDLKQIFSKTKLGYQSEWACG